MADILIRGMELPKSRGEYELRVYVDSDGTATAEGAYFRFDGEPFEIVPLPEGHGRLGDLDALQEEFKKYHDGKRLMLIDTALTIVPAEGGSDDEHV